MKNIGFVGLGHMGNPMAKNLLKAGFRVTVYDVNAVAVQALVQDGAKSAKQLKEVVEQADAVITMLQTGEQVTDVCLGMDGLFAHAKPDTVFIDCSSIEVATSQVLHDEAKQKNLVMVDAPVSGGVAGATQSTLTFMVGGEDSAFEQVKPLLAKMGKKIIHAGQAGHGQAAKICNNLILGISMIAVSEAFTLGEKLGLDPKKFFEISSNASGQCWAMTSYCPVPNVIPNVPANNAYQPGFMSKMMLKDLRLAQHAAESVGAILPLGEEATELYAKFVDDGHGEVDFSGIINQFKD